jgi:hypothetical protein
MDKHPDMPLPDHLSAISKYPSNLHRGSAIPETLNIDMDLHLSATLPKRKYIESQAIPLSHLTGYAPYEALNSIGYDLPRSEPLSFDHASRSI